MPWAVREGGNRAVHPGGDMLTGSRQVALIFPMPLASGDPEMELDMPTPEIFSAAGDVDETMRPVASQSEETTNTDIDNTENTEQNVGSDNAVGSGNEFEVDGLVGDVNAGDVNVGNVAGNGVTDVVGGVKGAVEGGDVTGGLQDLGGVNDVVGGVDDAVQGGDVMGTAGDLAGAGDVTGGLQDLGGVTGTVEDVTGELPVDGAVEGVMPESSLTAPVNAVEDVTGGVENTAGDLTGGMLDF